MKTKNILKLPKKFPFEENKMLSVIPKTSVFAGNENLNQFFRLETLETSIVTDVMLVLTLFLQNVLLFSWYF